MIRGQLQLGLRRIGNDPARARDAINLAIAQVDRMTKLLNLVDAAAVDADGLGLKSVAFDLVLAIADAIVRHEDGETPRITFASPPVPVPVHGDLDHTGEILDNC